MMMADAIEAASRTLEHATPDRVRELVDRIIVDRISDHQLDECPLTLKDITIIRVTLTEVVCAVLHQRVEYPGPCCEDSPITASREGRSEFDFYENFDPSTLFPISKDLFGEEVVREGDFPDEVRASSSRDDTFYSESFGAKPSSD
jgi:hypothetical protein